MSEEKIFTVAELRKCKEAVEKMRLARTEQHLEPIFNCIEQYTLFMDNYSIQEEGVRKFFFSDIIIPSVNFLINYKAYPGDYANKVEAYLKRILKFIVEQEDHIKLSEAFRSIFDPAKMFYQHNHLDKTLNDFNYNSSEVAKMQLFDAKEGLVDCLKSEKFIVTWSRAHLLFKGTNDSTICYMNTLNHEGIISNTREVMPYKSRTMLYYDKLMQLQVEDPVDFCDENGNWILTKILDRREFESQELVVQYKVPEEEQYLNATSPRIAPARLHSSKETPDSGDLIFQDEYQIHRFWALLRFKLNKSHCFVRILNYFGEINGFNELINRIGNEQKWYPIELLANYISGLGYASQQLSRQFAEEFVPQIKQLVTKNLLNSPESNIRNMAKDKLDHIVKGMENLLKKVSTSHEKLQWVEQISLELVIICFKSQFLDKKIQSLKYLVDVAKSVSANIYKTISLPQLVQQLLICLISYYGLNNNKFLNNYSIQTPIYSQQPDQQISQGFQLLQKML